MGNVVQLGMFREAVKSAPAARIDRATAIRWVAKGGARGARNVENKAVREITAAKQAGGAA